jgi:hypothetical protein
MDYVYEATNPKFTLANEEKYLPYASQLDLQVSSQEFPYRLHDDFGFGEIQREIDRVERINKHEAPKHVWDIKK